MTAALKPCPWCDQIPPDTAGMTRCASTSCIPGDGRWVTLEAWNTRPESPHEALLQEAVFLLRDVQPWAPHECAKQIGAWLTVNAAELPQSDIPKD